MVLIPDNLRRRIESHFTYDRKEPEHPRDYDVVLQMIAKFEELTGLEAWILGEAALELAPNKSGYMEYHLQNFLMRYPENSQYHAFGRFIGLMHRQGISIYDGEWEIQWAYGRKRIESHSTVKFYLTNPKVRVDKPVRITNDESTISFSMHYTMPWR